MSSCYSRHFGIGIGNMLSLKWVLEPVSPMPIWLESSSRWYLHCFVRVDGSLIYGVIISRRACLSDELPLAERLYNGLKATLSTREL